MAAGAAVGGASLISGLMGNKSAERQANKDRAEGAKLTDRATALFDTIFGLAKANLQNLSPEAQIGNLAKDTAKYSAIDQAGLSGAMSSVGYQPGDSEIGIRNDAVRQKYQEGFGTRANQIRTNAPMQQASLLSMANPNALNAGIDFWGKQQQYDMSRMQNPGSMFAAAMPFFGGKRPGFQLPGIAGGMAPGASGR